MSLLHQYATWLQLRLRQLRQPKKIDHALVSAGGLLAEWERSRTGLRLQAVETIARQYGYRNNETFGAFCRAIFRSCIQFFYTDHRLDDAELAVLRQLRSLLHLNNSVISEILDQERRRIMTRKVQEALSDGRVTVDERQALRRISEDLRLDPAIARRLLHHGAQQLYQRAADQAAADKRISDREMLELEAIAANLGLERPQLDQSTYAVFDRYRLYWLVENDRLPVLTTNLRLQHGERVHFMTDAVWLERKPMERTFEPSSVSDRVRFAHAYTFSTELLQPANIGHHEYKHLDNGVVQITNRRVLFTAPGLNRSVPLAEILSLFPHSNGISLMTSRSKSPFVNFETDVDLGSMILNQLLLHRMP